jgi:hypothetical protein
MARDLRGKICPFSIQAREGSRLAVIGSPVAQRTDEDANCARCKLDECAAFHDGDCSLIVVNHYMANNLAVVADSIKNIGGQIIAVAVTVAEKKLGLVFQREDEDNVVPIKKQ